MHILLFIVQNKIRENLAKQEDKDTRSEDKDFPFFYNSKLAEGEGELTLVLEEMDRGFSSWTQ